MDKIPLQKTIVIAPLDWGLGHAARCIPIIKELQTYHVNVIIAADGAVKTMMKQEFPQLLLIDLPGYKIKYSKNKRWFNAYLVIQFPKIIASIIKEHFWLKKVAKKYLVDAVISDNRFGLYHSSITSVYITHQLFIKTGNYITEKIAGAMHRWFINKYHQCWVPDFEGGNNIAGNLSHPEILPGNVKYIGCLSRFEQTAATQKEVDVLIILSGPEPQRTIFENMLLSQLDEFQGSVLMVRGLPGLDKQTDNPSEFTFKKNIVFKNHLTAQAMSQAIQSSRIVLSRSGYTTIMDLLKLGRNAILVPTPGQAEQEYLANFLSQKQVFFTAEQDGFLLGELINQANAFLYKMPAYDMELYKKRIRQFAETL